MQVIRSKEEQFSLCIKYISRKWILHFTVLCGGKPKKVWEKSDAENVRNGEHILMEAFYRIFSGVVRSDGIACVLTC